ncbi:MAG: efflux RND transporter permease subunit, partial [Bacteroidales bacterium]|nr:efflux RND transporter permease subunit [Bacteroidales bacterium]
MSIYSNSVKNPITTIMIFLAIIVFGLYSLSRLPIDLYPEIEFPFISVITTYQGASAQDIEKNLTEPIENALNSVDKLKEITSRSVDNTSVVFCEFEFGISLDEAANDIRNSLGFVERYFPEDAEDPIILKFNSSMMPILFYAITADESYAGIDKILDERIINPLNRIEGIGSIGLAGTPKREVLIEVDPLKLEAYNITLEQIGQVIQLENLNMPSGNVKMGKMDYALRVKGEFDESDEINNIVVGNINGQTIYIKDIAIVRDSIKEMTIDEKINGKKGIRMFVMKQSGANTVQIAKKVKKELDQLVKNLPSDIQIQTIFDSSEFIRGSINNLSETLLWALIFVILVVLFFLGRWRATFIVVITIPISLIVAFIFLQIKGSSINIISLSSLAIAIGMVVDDAIVVLENITKHIERGSSPREAAIYATNEVWLAVIVTTLTIVAVFFPLTLVKGLTGMFFNELGWIVTITVVTSTITAISLTPMLSSKLLRLRAKKEESSGLSYNNTILKFLDWLDDFYSKTLRWALGHKKTVIFSTIIVFGLSLFLLLKVGTEFMPETDQSEINALIELQTGTRVEETSKIARKIEAVIEKKYPEVTLISASSGSDEEGGFISIFSETGSHIINLQLALTRKDERERDVWTIAEDLRQEIDRIPEVINYNVTTSEGMGFGGNNVSVDIYGYDIEKTTNLANRIKEKISKIPGARNIQISRKKEKPELQVLLDQEKMSQHGINTATVSTALRNRVAGYTCSLFRESGDEYNVVVQFKKDYRNSISDIENISLTNYMGQSIKLKEIGKVEEFWSPPNIEHKRKERIVSVTAVPFQTSLGDLANAIKAELKDIDVPPEIMVEVGGAYEDQMESFADLGLLLLVSLLLVYIVMAAQFESLRMPFIIMFSIPFAFSGVFLALFITGKPLSVIAALGAVLLIGIVVKNAIVLVDYINLMRDRDYELREAILISGKSRLRPVLMTAVTTILGMLPMALSTGEGSEIWSPMGISVIGGLVFSSIITMVLV